MLKKTLLHLFLIALPFITYAIYVKLSRRSDPSKGIWRGAPWYWLTAGGLALSIAGGAVLIAFSGAEPGSVYVPAEVKDGKIIPGYFK